MNNPRYESAITAINAATTIARLGRLSAAITERANAGKFTPEETVNLHGFVLHRAFVLGGVQTPPARKPRKTPTQRVDETTGADKSDFMF